MLAILFYFSVFMPALYMRTTHSYLCLEELNDCIMITIQQGNVCIHNYV